MARNIDELMSTLTDAIAHLGFSDKPRVTLLTLPQEIQDIIFDLAYPELHAWPARWITKRDWEDRERERRRRNRAEYEVQSFQPKVHDFLVCKTFFIAAARAHIGNQFIGAELSQKMLCPHESFAESSAINAFVTRATMNSWILAFVDMPSTMHNLTIIIASSDFEIVEPKYAWEDDLEEEDFRAVIDEQKFTKISGLRELKLVGPYCPYANTAAKEVVWRSNVARLQDLVRQSAMQSKAEVRMSSNDTRRVPLYEGSSVRLHSSCLLGSPQTFSLQQTRELSKHGTRRLSANKPAATSDGSVLVPTSTSADGKAPKKTTNKCLHDQAPSSLSMSKRKKGNESVKRALNDQDIPRELEQFKALLKKDGPRVMEWINGLR